MELWDAADGSEETRRKQSRSLVSRVETASIQVPRIVNFLSRRRNEFRARMKNRRCRELARKGPLRSSSPLFSSIVPWYRARIREREIRAVIRARLRLIGLAGIPRCFAHKGIPRILSRSATGVLRRDVALPPPGNFSPPPNTRAPTILIIKLCFARDKREKERRACAAKTRNSLERRGARLNLSDLFGTTGISIILSPTRFLPPQPFRDRHETISRLTPPPSYRRGGGGLFIRCPKRNREN